jgi:Ca2+-binding EF-hand superfamily protein
MIMGAPGGSPSNSSDGDRTRMFADSMIRRSDRNGDGKLTRDEWSGVRDPDAADANRDGVITTDEMIARLQSFSRGGFGDRGSSDRDRSSSDRDRSFSDRDRGSSDRGSSDRERSFSGGPSGFSGGPGGFSGGPSGYSSRGGSDFSSRSGYGDRGSYSSSSGTGGANSAPVPKKSYALTSPIDRLPQNLPSWYFDSDKDGDGQIAMSEYRRRSSEKENAEEFLKIDANGDGLITSQECLTYIGGGSSSR